MNGNGNKKDIPTTTEVSVNWEGLKRFLGWQGTTTELKKVELDRSQDLKPRGTSGA